jgi:protein-S-isoprenylcysteine O-methyltransferase Ste14
MISDQWWFAETAEGGSELAVFALVVYVTFLTVVFGIRALVQYRRTGDHGIRTLAHARPSEWMASGLLVSGVALMGTAPIADLLGIVPLSSWTGATWLQGIGFGLSLMGAVLVVVSQYQMGHSWRVGVDPAETTVLMTDGLFAVVRNPIFGGVFLATVGFFLMLPSAVSAAASVCVFLGLEMQVRWIEEPYLARVHAQSYVSYARSVGRFVPGIGRIDGRNRDHS